MIGSAENKLSRKKFLTSTGLGTLLFVSGGLIEENGIAKLKDINDHPYPQGIITGKYYDKFYMMKDNELYAGIGETALGGTLFFKGAELLAKGIYTIWQRKKCETNYSKD